ncbi:hypothetical protein PYCC9005_004150 [Savitreella phatthalungensis]
MKTGFLLSALAATLPALTLACDDDDWYSPEFRHSIQKRSQPGAVSAPTAPIQKLKFGQVNVAYTTDTHGWLASHATLPSYSADWGDYISFLDCMMAKADALGVDLIVADAGDLHDGTGIGDLAGSVNGQYTLPIFGETIKDNIVASIGNHELYTAPIANDTYYNLAPRFNGRYLTSNVDFYDNGTWKPFSNRYAYWQTKFGVRILALGVLFNFTGNTNITRVQPVLNMTREFWFQQQINRTDVDLFLLVGHTPVRGSYEWDTVYSAIRRKNPATPITIVGGHSHIRDTTVFDAAAIGVQAGRYCETVGWLALSGLNSSTANLPSGTLPAITASPSSIPNVTQARNSSLGVYRQYLDFNRFVFSFHTDTNNATFDTARGVNVSRQVTQAFTLNPNLTTVIGCAPQTYYQNQYPLGDGRNLYTLLTDQVFPNVVVTPGRESQPRIVLINTGAVRFDLPSGPFTIDVADSVLPFTNTWYRKTAPWSQAKNLLASMNTDKVYKRQEYSYADANQTTGYVTKDDLGSDGDNTKHIAQGRYSLPHYVQGNASLPTGSDLTDSLQVDVYAASFFINAASAYLSQNTTDWIPVDGSFSAFDTLPRYAASFWNGTTC